MLFFAVFFFYEHSSSNLFVLLTQPLWHKTEILYLCKICIYVHILYEPSSMNKMWLQKPLKTHET
jgi:hypothetical protein